MPKILIPIRLDQNIMQDIEKEMARMEKNRTEVIEEMLRNSIKVRRRIV